MAEDITGQDTDLINGEPSEYSNLVTLESLEHVRLRPGMYIGRLGDGSQSDDGIYVLFKEVMDNAVDEHLAGYGNVIEVTLADNVVTIRDYGRGIPLPDVVNAASKMNTSGKFDSSNYKGSVGLNGVGIKADDDKATWYFKRSSAISRTGYSEYWAGMMFLNGEEGFIEKNKQKALHWLNLSCMEGFDTGCEEFEKLTNG